MIIRWNMEDLSIETYSRQYINYGSNRVFFCFVFFCNFTEYQDLRAVVRESPHSVQLKKTQKIRTRKLSSEKLRFYILSYLPVLLLIHIWTYIENEDCQLVTGLIRRYINSKPELYICTWEHMWCVARLGNICAI